MIVGDRGINITLGGLSNLCLEFEEQVDKLEKRKEELELFSDNLLEENAALKGELDEATEEILRLENKISELQISDNNDDNADDHERY